MSSPRPRKATPTASPRAKSAIGIARGDLVVAIATARQIRDSGLAPMPLRQLAATLAPDERESTFVSRFYAAAAYGLVALQQGDDNTPGVVVTLPLLAALDDPTGAATARAQACLHVPLHRAIVARYRNQPLPQLAELTRVLVEEFSIGPKRAVGARQTLRGALDQAGFVGPDDRLIIPPGIARPLATPLAAANTVSVAVPSDDAMGPSADVERSDDALLPVAAAATATPSVTGQADPAIREGAPEALATIDTQARVLAVEPRLIEWLSEARPAWSAWPEGKKQYWVAALVNMLNTYSHGE